MFTGKGKKTDYEYMEADEDTASDITTEAHHDEAEGKAEGMTALAFGIMSGNTEVIDLLAPITTVGENKVILMLAQSNLKIEGEIETYLRRINKNELLLEKASNYGNVNLLDYLLNKSNFVYKEKLLLHALRNAVLSDEIEPVKIVHDFIRNQDIISMGRIRSILSESHLQNSMIEISKLISVLDNEQDKTDK